MIHIGDNKVSAHCQKDDEAVEIDSGLEDSYRQLLSRIFSFVLLTFNISPSSISSTFNEMAGDSTFKAARNKAFPRSSFGEDRFSLNCENQIMLKRSVVILIIIFICLTSIMIVFNAGQNHSNGIKEEEVFHPPSLQKNFLLEDDITYLEVKKRKRTLEEKYPNGNTNYNLFAQNEKLLLKISKTFSEIVKVGVPDTTNFISAKAMEKNTEEKKQLF